MMARRGALGLVAGSIAALLGGCGLLFRSGSYRFRMTVEVETPEGVRTGSSVYEVSGRRSVALTSEESKGSVSVRGEALVVDLPGGPLFVTLKMPVAGQTLAGPATRALAPDTKRGDFDALMAAVGKLGGMFASARADLPRKDWPLMVRFRDIADPASVVEVDPEVAGVRRIIIETTSEDVTTGISERLAWLGTDPLTLGNGKSMGPPMGGGYLGNNAFWNGTAR
jgi:hypothetical protein